MNKILLNIFAAGLLFSIGHALQCYKCDLGLGSLCITYKIPCDPGEKCFSGVATAGTINIKSKGCLAANKCNKTESVTFPGSNSTVYTETKTCCESDLCNAASSLVHLNAFPLALLTLTSFLVTKVLL
ncbi:lymphocyte antigen 6 complex locus protein G6d [Osmerus eperlanus]|uniref:lymphocyte antigen 6 complex locus protein G6d n=1 Tax=Osmerus eperlanus TaxID=29151 RepID=UPI002E153C8A